MNQYNKLSHFTAYRRERLLLFYWAYRYFVSPNTIDSKFWDQRSTNPSSRTLHMQLAAVLDEQAFDNVQ